MKKKVGIIGATGYTGIELMRLLLGHKEVELVAISSFSYANLPISDIYPSLNHISDLICSNSETVIEKADLIFTALPHGLAEPIAELCYAKDKILIDLGPDFRLKKEADYEKWYGSLFLYLNLHEQAVYALPEIYKNEIKGAKILANPGCYVTASLLALYPLVKNNTRVIEDIIIDAKSGVSGAGKSLSDTTHFMNVHENFYPYSIAQHRHTPEIEQVLSEVANETVQVTFTPHLLPITRGILATIYVSLNEKIDLDTIKQSYVDTYKNEPFIRVLELGKTAQIKYVQNGQFCDISLHYDRRMNKLIIVSALDNLLKGASGQAVQNMNIVLGCDETEGLYTPPRTV